MEQLIVLIVVGVIAFLNWLIKKGAKDAAGQELPPFPRGQIPRQTQTQTVQSEEERLRKFMEALGVPSVPEAPRKITRPPQIPQPAPQIQPPYKKEIPKPVPKAPPPPVPVAVPQVVESRTPAWETSPSPAALDVPLVEIAVPSAATAAAPAVPFKSLLRSPSSLRTAIILKEVLGPPKGLQTSTGVPGLS